MKSMLHELFEQTFGRSYQEGDERLLQNTVYLAQEFGASLGYNFRTSNVGIDALGEPKYGMVCRELATEAKRQDLQRREVKLSVSIMQALEKVKNILAARSGKYSESEWLECAATIHHIVNYLLPDEVQEQDKGSEKAVSHLLYLNSTLNRKEENLRILLCLNEAGGVPESTGIGKGKV